MPIVEVLGLLAKTNMKITAILAMTEKWVIGKYNSLPWDIPEDLARFRELTTDNVVIMWKNTYFSLPKKYRPLPRRRNIVFTRESIDWVECVQNIDELKNILQDEKRKIFLIWWAKLYNYFFENNYVDFVELTLLNEDYKWDVFVKEFRHNFLEIQSQVFSDWKFISLIRK